MTDKFSARLHILLARESPLAVVFRRGPSKQVCTFLWDREKDSFELGQWLKGRIYERCSDLSADGKHLIYFATKGKKDLEVGYSWTTVSRAPWLKAIALYKGDCGMGGGLFITGNRYWLNHEYVSRDDIISESSEVQRYSDYVPKREVGPVMVHIRYQRLLRDGWNRSKSPSRRFEYRKIFEKPLPEGWVLRKIAHEQVDPPKGKGCYWDYHILENKDSDKLIVCKDWEWAEVDGSSLVWAEKGRLYRSGIESAEAIGEPKLLYDFNPLKFKRIKAPY